MVAVVVKWGKNTYEVELDTSESVETFKAQLFALTSVPIERQKIMGVKGGTMKVRGPPGRMLSLSSPAQCMRPPLRRTTRIWRRWG